MVPNYFVILETETFLFKAVFFNICLIYLLVTLFKLYTIFSKEDEYIIKNENGSVHISAETVKTLIKELLSSDKEIKGLKIDCGKRGKKFFVKISVEILSETSIAAKTTSVQNYIKNSLEEKLDLKVDEIEVKISKLSVKKDTEMV